MSVLDDYLYQKESRYRKYEKYMSSYDRKNAQNEIKELKNRSRDASSPYSGKPTNQGFRAAEKKSKSDYDVYKTIKDAMERMLNTGHEIDEATLEMEIPAHMLRNNPNLVDDIAKQVAGELAKSDGLYDYDIEVELEQTFDNLGIDLFEDPDLGNPQSEGSLADRGYPSTLTDYAYMKLTKQGSATGMNIDPYHYIPQGDYPGYPDYDIADLPYGEAQNMGKSGCSGAAPVNAVQPFIEYTILEGMTDYEMMRNAANYFLDTAVTDIGIGEIADYVNYVSEGKLTTKIMTNHQDVYEAVQDGATFVVLMSNNYGEFTTDDTHWISGMYDNQDGTVHVNSTNEIGAAAQLAKKSDYMMAWIDHLKAGDNYLVINTNDANGGN